MSVYVYIGHGFHGLHKVLYTVYNDSYMSLFKSVLCIQEVISTIPTVYSGPCDLRLPIQPAKYGLKLKVVLK